MPLNALIQFHARDSELGTVLAGNNWVQNLVMLCFLGLTVLFAIKGINSVGLLHLLTLTALVGAIYTVYQLPQSLVRLVIARLFASTHRIEVLGFDNLPGQGGVLMLGNHISWLDWAMIQIACPGRCASSCTGDLPALVFEVVSGSVWRHSHRQR